MGIILILAIVAAIVGVVLSVRSKTYDTGTFWLLIALVLAVIVSQVSIHG